VVTCAEEVVGSVNAAAARSAAFIMIFIRIVFLR
jgi:hypothetical protein